MSYWFQCTVDYVKQAEDGGEIKVKEPSIVDAINFTEAERRIIDEKAPYIRGAFEVKDIRRVNFNEVFDTADAVADKFYKAKLEFITLDERSGKEKKTSAQYLVQAADFEDSVKRLKARMSGVMMDYTIVSIAETKITDIYHYQQPAPEGFKKVNE